MNRLKSIIISTVALSAILVSCDDDFLERYPLDQVSQADYFSQPADLEVYMNDFYCLASFPNTYAYVLAPPTTQVPNYTISSTYKDNDRNANIEYDSRLDMDARLVGSRTVSNSGPWNFDWIRNVNYFFDNYRKCQGDFSGYKQYVGEAHFFRALYYFRLLKLFGDVPWNSTVLGTSSPELFNPRTPRHLVADSIIADLDKAALYLSAEKGTGAGRLNKWVALLFQSRVALYEGTWQKYHADDDFKAAVSNPAKYLNKAVEAATAVMQSGLYNIYSTGKPEADYYDLFIQRTYSGNSEALFWTQFSVTLGLEHNKNFTKQYPRQLGITKQLADAYLCNDGKPISVSGKFAGYNTLADEAKDRDPRYYQTIFTPAVPWEVDAQGNTKLWQEIYVMLNGNYGSTYESPTGYHMRKGYDPRLIYHDTNHEDGPNILFRYAEVLLNYAEAKAELGTLTQDDINLTVKKLRDRVGMPNLNLGSITADPKWDFPTLTPTINEIRRERLVELACEGFRWDDIARWAAADELIVNQRPKGAKKAQFVGTMYDADAEGFLDPAAKKMPGGYQFRLNRDYLDAIPESQLTLNPNLTQNPNW